MLLYKENVSHNAAEIAVIVAIIISNAQYTIEILIKVILFYSEDNNILPIICDIFFGLFLPLENIIDIFRFLLCFKSLATKVTSHTYKFYKLR
jgi:hypothetical protein